MTAEHHRHHDRHPRRRDSEIAPFKDDAYNLRINRGSYELLVRGLVWVDVRPCIPEYVRIRPGNRVRYNGALVRTVKDVERHETLDDMLTPDNLRLFNGYGLTRDELIQGIRRFIRQEDGFLLFIHERLAASSR